MRFGHGRLDAVAALTKVNRIITEASRSVISDARPGDPADSQPRKLSGRRPFRNAYSLSGHGYAQSLLGLHANLADTSCFSNNPDRDLGPGLHESGPAVTKPTTPAACLW
jgi:hypothetical protein